MKQPLLNHVKPLIRLFSIAIIIQVVTLDDIYAENKTGKEKTLKQLPIRFY